jgi:hypothetical protein
MLSRMMLLGFFALSELWAQMDTSVINVRRNRDWNSEGTSGWCAVKVWVDDEAEFTLQGDRLTMRTLNGRAARDIATECGAPMPGSMEVFRFKGIDGRGQVELVEDPSRTRNGRATVRIRDPRAGGEEFHYRLEWEKGNNSGGGFFNPPAKESGTASGNFSGDNRDVTRWLTKHLREEIERLYEGINKRPAPIDTLDSYIDRVRFDRWNFAEIARDIERRR